MHGKIFSKLLGNRSIDLIKAYLPHARTFWSTQAGAYAIENLIATTRIFYIDLKPTELKLADLAFFICHLSGGKHDYNAVKKELHHGESKRQARTHEGAQGGKELQRESAVG